MSARALFTRQGDIYCPLPFSASPWHPDILHGGACSGLLTWLLEQNAPAGKQLCRVGIDLLRPVPRLPLEARTRIVRDGGRLSIREVELWHDGKLCTRAAGTFVAPTTISLPDYTPDQQRMLPVPEFVKTADLDAFLDQKDVKIPPGLHSVLRIKPITPMLEQGSGRWWMNLPIPLVEGEELTPLAHVGVLADYCNGVGQLNLGGGVGMINADVSLQLHRIPEGEWIGLDGIVRAQPNGIGTTQCRLFDVRGEIGFVMQTVMPKTEFNAG